MPTALQWREKARYCRQLAHAADASTAESLEMLATSYDEDACRAEALDAAPIPSAAAPN